MKARVAVAMSGGVDSSVVAAILKEERYEVIGLYMCLYSPEESLCCERDCSCCDGLFDARQVADYLNIPLYIFDFRQEFREKVVDYFCQEYQQGRTPNPCVVCNREIKFGLLLDKARESGAQFLATGHYARIERSGEVYFLKKGLAANSDQSYFLYTLNQEKMANLLMVLGNYTKSEVRKLARNFALPIAGKRASQEVCFIKGDYREFLRTRISHRPGDIVDKQGNVLGRHDGVGLYTIGQRRKVGSYGMPFYVISIDGKEGKIVVGTEEELFGTELIVRDLSFTYPLEKEALVNDVLARIRYNHTGEQAKLDLLGDRKAHVIFRRPVRAITPGQAIVFYQGDIVLGGGTIEQVVK